MATRSYLVVKRVLDVILAGIVLVVTAPLMAAIALAVRVDSPGPVLFRHQRIGRRFAPFELLKFRTMRHEPHGGPEITRRGDPRVTRVGRLLRLTKLDELPQLWNVLRGDMSLVGPRPEVRTYVELFREDYDRILAVRPGLTDDASIAFRSEERILGEANDAERMYVEVVLPQKIALSQRYVREMSFAKDVGVMLRTVWAVLKP